MAYVGRGGGGVVRSIESGRQEMDYEVQGGRWGAANRATVGVAASWHGDGGAEGDIRWNSRMRR